MKHNYDFWNNKLPKGFYDDIFRQGKSNNASLQSSWHNLTFLKIKDYVDESSNLLDYACGPGTFTGNYTNCNSIGFDISPNQIDYANEKYKNSIYRIIVVPLCNQIKGGHKGSLSMPPSRVHGALQSLSDYVRLRSLAYR